MEYISKKVEAYGQFVLVFIKAKKNYFVLGVPNFKTKIFIFEYFSKISS